MSLKYPVVDGITAREIDPESLPWTDESLVAYAIDEETKEVVGRLGRLHLAHIEGAWIREDYRNLEVLQNLVNKIETIMKAEGKTSAMAFALEKQPDIADYLKRLGYVEMPMKIFVRDLNK